MSKTLKLFTESSKISAYSVKVKKFFIDSKKKTKTVFSSLFLSTPS